MDGSFATAPAGTLDPEQLHDTGRFGAVRVVARRCPLCDADNARPLEAYTHDIWQMQQCRSCDFVYLGRAPDYTALFAAMAWEKTHAAEIERRVELRPVSHRLSRVTRLRMRLLPRKRMAELIARHAPPGNVIDLGCGTGTQLSGLPSGYVPFGVEVSTEAAEAADRMFRPRGGWAVNQPSLGGLQALPADFFVAASLRSYLEHEMQPMPVLRELHRTLAPGGVAIVKVPNFASLNRHVTGRKWCGLRYPDHVNQFTPTTLRAMAEASGYSIRFGLTDRLPTSDNMYALLIKA